MSHFIFNESGSIPGVPGQFAGCHVTVNDDGTLDIQPIAQQPHVIDAPAIDALATTEQITEAATPENIEEAK